MNATHNSKMKLQHVALVAACALLAFNVYMLVRRSGMPDRAPALTAVTGHPEESPPPIIAPKSHSVAASAPAASPAVRPIPRAKASPQESRRPFWLIPAVTSQPSLDQVTRKADDLLDVIWPEPQSTTNDAGQLLASKDFAKAVTAYDRLLVRSPNDTTLLLGKGMALVGLNRNEDALALFESAVEHDPANTSARFNQAVTLARLEQSEEAEKAFQELLKCQPRHARARFNLATLLTARQQYNDALPLWRQLTESAPPVTTQPGDVARLTREFMVQAWSHRGECALALAKLIESEQCFQQVVNLLPDARAWANLGIAKAALSKNKEAKAALSKAIELDPKLIPALNQLAYINAVNYHDTGDAQAKAQVLELCQRSLALAPSQANVRQLRFALEHENDPEPTPDDSVGAEENQSQEKAEHYRELRK